jgi:hypothetical protein
MVMSTRNGCDEGWSAGLEGPLCGDELRSEWLSHQTWNRALGGSG